MPDRASTVDTIAADLRSGVPGRVAAATDLVRALLSSTPEINPGFKLPNPPGVVRYDAAIHTEADIAQMTPYLQQRIAQAKARGLPGRLVIKQTAPFPGDSPEHSRALIAAQHGLHLVSAPDLD